MKYAYPVLVGHRGIGDPWTAKLKIPEESVPAIEWAAKHHANILEGDAQVSGPDASGNRVMYMMHDDHLDRTTNGDGGSNARPWTYIRDLRLELPVDADGNKNPDNTPYHPPSLRTWLAAAKETGKRVFCELKGPWSEANIKKYADELREQNMTSRVITASGETRLSYFRKYSIGARSWSVGHLPSVNEVLNVVGGGGYATVSLPVAEQAPGYVRSLQDRGIKVFVYTLDGPKHYGRAAVLGAYGWFCDNTNDAWSWLEENLP